MDRLKGKIAIVTGIGSGIGKGCALRFLAEGATVVGCDLDPVAAAATVQEASQRGLSLDSVHPCNLTRPEDVQALVAHTLQRHGGIDILVNAAAWGAFEFIESMDYQSQWKTTLTGEIDVVFLACQAVWPHMQQRGGGAIINFASANAYQALPGSGALAHCAGKGAVLAMTRQLAMEGGPHRIRANTISPALVVTGATQPRLDNEPGFREAVTAKMMIGRLGTPDDIAWCATYLASDEAGWVTAADFRLDGGATAW
ncbi:SDR family oxidoreductase [Pseudoxanthomonas sp.]|uniref:SDR family NAD(P)-dependent oxidoreductase n=1 Tax=Pseudoxanthomonas sp. TaxID=1871049 RepID=UPI002611FC6E|nr:SDR family oxidoreductase [Pseudoxanthomonas sp.]WDS35022.1 MAG: SDR family oxidoreductase [Pseudoxanthomonas sp.]